MELVGGIKVLLHDRGLTIRGVQRMIRESGVAAVAALSPPLDLAEMVEGDVSDDWTQDAARDAQLAKAPVAAPQAAPAQTPPLQAAAPVAPTQPSLALDLPLAPVPTSAAPAPVAQGMGETAPSPGSVAALSRLAALVADPARLSPGARARLRPALVSLRDRMRADPPR
jgi:hypothetical protein